MKFETIKTRLEEISANLDNTSGTPQDVARHVMQQERAFKNLLMDLPTYISGFITEQKQSLREFLVNVNQKLLKVKSDNLQIGYRNLLVVEKRKFKMQTQIQAQHPLDDVVSKEIKKSHDEYNAAIKIYKQKYEKVLGDIKREYEDLEKQFNKIIPTSNSIGDITTLRRNRPKGEQESMDRFSGKGIGIPLLRGMMATGQSEDFLKEQQNKYKLIEEARIKRLLEQRSPFSVPGRNPKISSLEPLPERAPLTKRKSSKLGKRR